MNILKYTLIVIYIINCLALIVLAMMQAKDDAGMSGAIAGSTSNFYEKNKGRTREGMLKRYTIISGTLFAVLSIGLGIVYMA